jgi:hypothetical protein
MCKGSGADAKSQMNRWIDVTSISQILILEFILHAILLTDYTVRSRILRESC